MTSRASSHWSGVSTEAGICLLQMSCENAIVFFVFWGGVGEGGDNGLLAPQHVDVGSGPLHTDDE